MEWKTQRAFNSKCYSLDFCTSTRDSAQRNDNSKENQGVQRFYTTNNNSKISKFQVKL